ncbi:MAG: adenylyltransferase/cytidyltransferase family protein [Lachnospiraceae bacterium]|nr:adenylyltransferase/cytidyltransferase family protein [Lachnospiraceae bacterium]
MASKDKIVTKGQFKDEIRPKLKSKGKRIALCHGVFDLVHPGHISHFEQAKAMADVLVVSITAAKYVRKGPDRPYFDDDTRLGFLSAIECIDYVMLSECHTVDDIIEAVEPDLYVKGSEYADEDADVTGMIRRERELCEAHGGRMAYTGGQVYSSTKLINTALSALPEDVRQFMEGFRTRYSMSDITGYADKAEKLRVLVVGDVIIDRYVYCTVQGLMSKDMAYSARKRSQEDYLGGAVAIARCLSGFSYDVTLMSITGNEKYERTLLANSATSTLSLDLIHSRKFPTIVKQRYLVKNDKREEYDKVFVINNIPDTWDASDPARAEFKKKLKDTIAYYDAVFLCDFGHGLIDREVMDIVQEKAYYLVLNCQTNSTNRGLNNITKYHRADAFSLDQGELKLAFPEHANDEREGLQSLEEHLKARSGWLTRGSAGAWSYDGESIVECPAFTLTVKDTIGAGDAFYSVAGIFSAAGASAELSMVMGNIAGALGANIVGNKSAVEKVNVLKYASTLMNV